MWRTSPRPCVYVRSSPTSRTDMLTTMDERTAAAIKGIEDLTAEILAAFGHGQTHNDNADHAPKTELPAIIIGADGIMTGEACHSIPCTKRSYLTQAAKGKVVGVLWHYTDTNGSPGSILKLAERLAQPGGRQASWHVGIGRDGLLAQSVPFTMGSWHAGSSTAKRFTPSKVVTGFWAMDVDGPKGKVGANSLFAGIELECVGEVRKVGSSWRGWPFGKPVAGHGPGALVKAEEVVEAKDPTGRTRHWQNFTQAQEDAAERMLVALHYWGGVDRSQCAFSHQMVDPTRRTDPGPVWMEQCLPRVLSRVYG